MTAEIAAGGLEALEDVAAAVLLRREIGSRLQLRYTPELVFELDDSIEHGARIFDLIEQLHRKEDSHDQD